MLEEIKNMERKRFVVTELFNIAVNDFDAKYEGRLCFDTCLSICLSVHREGTPPGQVQTRGVPWPGPTGGGVPQPGPMGGTPSQVQWRYTQGGVPPSRNGVPPWQGVPSTGRGYPPPRYRTTDDRWSTWYAAVGMPLAFMQDDFLVVIGVRCNRYRFKWVLIGIRVFLGAGLLNIAVNDIDTKKSGCFRCVHAGRLSC